MKYLAPGLFAISFAILSFMSYDLYGVVKARKTMKEDFAEINMVNYELFNVQLWKDQALTIFQKKIKEFEISPEVYVGLGVQVEAYLHRLYGQYIKSGVIMDLILGNLEKEGKVNKMFMNIIKANVTDQLDQLNVESQIPAFAAQVTDEIKRNEPMFKAFLQQELLRLILDETMGSFRDRRQVIYKKYNRDDLDQTDAFLDTEITKLNGIIGTKMKWIMSILGLNILLPLLFRKIIGFKGLIGSLTLVSVALLILGVTLPMIDIDARLNSFSFYLMDEPISFSEQVIFYQSKSIVEVTQTLWEGGTIDLKIVGVLVLMFSIVFPFFKLSLSAFYLFVEKVRSNHLAKTIIFHLGKWSMADVFVIAMFMAYFGFYGLISSQLGTISQNQGGFAIETINYSKLSPGAFFFTGYTILSIFIGILINRESKMIDESTVRV